MKKISNNKSRTCQEDFKREKLYNILLIQPRIISFQGQSGLQVHKDEDFKKEEHFQKIFFREELSLISINIGTHYLNQEAQIQKEI